MPKRIRRIDGKLVDLKRVQIVEPPMAHFDVNKRENVTSYALTMVSGVTVFGSNIEDYPQIEADYIALMEADNPNFEKVQICIPQVTAPPNLPEVKVKFEARVNGNAYVFEVGSVILATVSYVFGNPCMDTNFLDYEPQWFASIGSKAYQNTESMRDTLKPYVESYVKALFG